MRGSFSLIGIEFENFILTLLFIYATDFYTTVKDTFVHLPVCCEYAPDSAVSDTTVCLSYWQPNTMLEMEMETLTAIRILFV